MNASNNEYSTLLFEKTTPTLLSSRDGLRCYTSSDKRTMMLYSHAIFIERGTYSST